MNTTHPVSLYLAVAWCLALLSLGASSADTTLETDGGIFSIGVDMTGRQSTVPHINNVGGDTVFDGTITLERGHDPGTAGNNFTFVSSAGTLTLERLVGAAGDDGPDEYWINLGGDGDGVLLDLQQVNVYSEINKSGQGTWVLGENIQRPVWVNVNQGTLQLDGPLGDRSWPYIEIADGATLRQGALGAISEDIWRLDVSGTVDVNGFDTSMPVLMGSSTGVITNGATNLARLIFANSEPGTDFPGRIEDGAGPIAVVVDSELNVVRFTGNNSYSGGTTIEKGLLYAEGALSSGTAGTLVKSGGALAVGVTDDQVHVDGGSLRGGTFLTDVSLSGDSIVLSGILSGRFVHTGDTTNDRGSVLFGDVQVGSSSDLGARINGEVDLTKLGVAYASNSGSGGASVTLLNMSGIDSAELGVSALSGASYGKVNMSNTLSANVVQGGSPWSLRIDDDLDMTSSRGGSALVSNIHNGYLYLHDVDMSGRDSAEIRHRGFKEGPGFLAITGEVLGVQRVSALEGGRVILGANASVTGVDRVESFLVTGDASIIADAILSGVTLGSGQRIYGDGTVTGDFVVNPGAVVEVGNGFDIVDLAFEGNLSFAADSVLSITVDVVGPGVENDLLLVSDLLSLDSGTRVSFEWLGGPTILPFVFAEYGSFSGTCPANTGLSAGYSIDCNYEGQSQIALLYSPVAAPAPFWFLPFWVALFLLKQRAYTGSMRSRMRQDRYRLPPGSFA